MKVAILGAAGKLGRRLVESGLARGHDVTAIVRNLAPQPAAPSDIIRLRQVVCDLRDRAALEATIAGQDALISAAGNVADGATFRALFDGVTSAAERALGGQRRVWMLAGALVLDMPQTRQMGASLPFMPKRYWPHIENWRRLERSNLDWALMCPGPMKPGDGQPIASGLQMSCDAMPFEVGPWARYAPPIALSLLLKSQLPRLRVPFRAVADAMIDHLDPGGPFSRKRVGLGWINPSRVIRGRT